MRRERRRPFVAGMVILACAAAMTTIPAQASAAQPSAAARAQLRPQLLPPPPPACPSLTFIGARGSGESFSGYNGLGPAVWDMAVNLQAVLAKHGMSVSQVPDPYPADSVSDLSPSGAELLLFVIDPPAAVAEYVRDNLEKYIHSIDTGISDAVALAEDTVASCPNGKLVLAGYSQGAMVMHQAQLQLAASGRKRVLRQIAGTLLLGDGDRVPDTRAHEFGSSLARAEGIRTYLHSNSGQDVEQPARTANICNAGDIVCDFNFERLTSFSHAAKVHTSYARQTSHGIVYSPLLAQAAIWLADKIVSH